MKEKRTRSVGGSVIPEPLTPYPYIATAFFTVIFVNTPLNPYLATGFKTRKCNLNAILMRFRSKRARTNKPNAWNERSTRSKSIIQPPSCVVDQWVPINLHLEGVGL